MNDSRKYWVGFNLVKGIGPARLRALLDVFGDAETAWKASVSDLREAGLGTQIFEQMVQVREEIDLEQIWASIEAKNVGVITWIDENYPRRLKDLDYSPPVLYIRGELLPDDDWAVAMVGTRRMTGYGRQVATDVASYLASRGVTIISGLARGIDSVAHEAALQVGGRTIAVLGNGVDIIYPPEHRRLAQRIIECGALISDYPPGTPPESSNFPPRNRIISGLSKAVIVVEAGKKSGALITASFAAEQGREVFAVPGNIIAPQSKGTNHLIQQGARPLLDPQDVLDVLNLTQLPAFMEARTLLPADAKEAQLMELLRNEPYHVDELCERTGWMVEEVSSTLALMELKGMVRSLGGMNYMAVMERRDEYSVEEDE
ncbi:MAG: DNA-processing protein DprA [Chloroflexota bacterium]